MYLTLSSTPIWKSVFFVLLSPSISPLFRQLSPFTAAFHIQLLLHWPISVYQLGTSFVCCLTVNWYVHFINLATMRVHFKASRGGNPFLPEFSAAGRQATYCYWPTNPHKSGIFLWERTHSAATRWAGTSGEKPGCTRSWNRLDAAQLFAGFWWSGLVQTPLMRKTLPVLLGSCSIGLKCNFQSCNFPFSSFPAETPDSGARQACEDVCVCLCVGLMAMCVSFVPVLPSTFEVLSLRSVSFIHAAVWRLFIKNRLIHAIIFPCASSLFPPPSTTRHHQAPPHPSARYPACQLLIDANVIWLSSLLHWQGQTSSTLAAVLPVSCGVWAWLQKLAPRFVFYVPQPPSCPSQLALTIHPREPRIRSVFLFSSTNPRSLPNHIRCNKH